MTPLSLFQKCSKLQHSRNPTSPFQRNNQGSARRDNLAFLLMGSNIFRSVFFTMEGSSPVQRPRVRRVKRPMSHILGETHLEGWREGRKREEKKGKRVGREGAVQRQWEQCTGISCFFPAALYGRVGKGDEGVEWREREWMKAGLQVKRGPVCMKAFDAGSF